MRLFSKQGSKFWHFDFTVRGRYRGSTKETKKARADKIASMKLAAAIGGADPLDRKAPTLVAFSRRFLEWVSGSRLDHDTQRYYRNGWRLLQSKRSITGMRLDRIDTDQIEKLRFRGSASNGNNALRTLRRMLYKAKEAKLIREVPRFRLFKENGRVLLLDDEAERRLLPVAEQPLKDIIVLMRDTGMRNGCEIYPLRIENIRWNDKALFNPRSKTPKGRRLIALSDRALEILRRRSAGRSEGWVFASKRKGKHIGAALMNRLWVQARAKAGLPEDLKLYCARHDFGTYVLNTTGNLKLVMDTMGHTDVATAMKYQHPQLEMVRRVINTRHTLRPSSENGDLKKTEASA